MKTKDEIFGLLKVFLAKEMGSKQVNIADRWVADLGLDSLELVETVMSLEREVGVSISDEVLASVGTIENLVDAIYNAQ